MRAWQKAILALVLLGVGAAFTRSWWMSRDPWDSSDLVNVPQQRLRAVPMRPVADLDEPALRDLVSTTMTWPKEMPPGSGPLDALQREFARFYALRFLTQDVDQYVQWRRASGYRLRDYDEMNRAWQIEQDYAAFFNEPAPKDRDIDAMFRKFFEIGLTASNGSAKPIKVADSAEGLAVAVGVMTSPSQPRLAVAGVMPAEIWQGKISGTTRNWWNAPTSWRDVLKRDRRVVWAEIGIVTTFADGAVHPRVHSFFWDPARGMWMLDTINDTNFIRPGAALEY
jgi:hypothetical protein